MPKSAKVANLRLQKLPRSGSIKIDRNACLACRECEVACSLYHEGECNPALSRIQVTFDDFVLGFPNLWVCKQCDWPACYYACADVLEESAIEIDPATGARFINEEKCIGCGACLRACPLTPEMQVIHYKMVNDKRVYFKCDLCKDRPEGPLCVEICPGEALTFTPAKKGGKAND